MSHEEQQEVKAKCLMVPVQFQIQCAGLQNQTVETNIFLYEGLMPTRLVTTHAVSAEDI